MAYEFYYWPSIQGRGEFVRLALEEAGAEYIDVARRPESEGGGVATLMAFLEREDIANPPFAPPFLKDGEKATQTSDGWPTWPMLLHASPIAFHHLDRRSRQARLVSKANPRSRKLCRTEQTGHGNSY